MHLNITDVVLGGLMIVTAIMLLQHFRKQPDSPTARKWRVLSIILMIIGWMIVVWDPMWTLAFATR